MTVAELKSYRSSLKGLASSLDGVRAELESVASGGRYTARVRQRASGYIQTVDSMLGRIDSEVQAVNQAITEASEPDPTPAPPDPQPSPSPSPDDPVQPREPVRRL